MITGVALVAASSGGAFAQTAPAPAAASTGPIQELVVTGSRIKGLTNQTAVSPISTATNAQIQLTKATALEDVLLHLPGVDLQGGISAASNNGGIGASVIGLRGLGTQRSVILVDGQRLIATPGSTSSYVDLNSIPLPMVDRVEVLRDGASSIYGADAIGGVVNIITKKNFEGVEADAYIGQTTHNDTLTYSMSGTVGVNSDKANVTISVGWDKRDALPESNRAWAVDPHLNAAVGEGGSTYRSQLSILQDPNSHTVWANGLTLDRTDPTVNWSAIDPRLLYLPVKGTVKLNAGSKDWNVLTSGLERKQISFSSHYDFSDSIKFVLNGFFTDRNSNQQLRAEPLLGGSIASTVFAGLFIPQDAPGQPVPGVVLATAIANGTADANGAPVVGGPANAGMEAYLTPDQFGPRIYTQDVKTYRINAGFEGEIAGKYDWQLGYVYQGQDQRQDTLNEGNFEHLAQITELIGCQDVPGGCHLNGAGFSVPNVQPNWFNGPNNIFSQAQLDYLRFDNVQLTHSNQNYAYANLSGPLFNLPFGTVKASIGGEIRHEYQSNLPSILVQEGWGPNESQPTAGGYNVDSVYGELNIPLLKDVPFAKALTLAPSGRFDHYSNFGNAYTYKIGLNWEINDDLRFRSSWSTGFRAPNVTELFGGQGISDNGAQGDPCDSRGLAYGVASGNSNIGVGVLTPGSTCSLAVANGLAVTNFQPAQDNSAGNQIQVLQGGNTQLKPEKSESFTAGIIISPRWTPGLVFSADYYWVRINNTILIGGISGNSSPNLVLNGCYGPAQNQSFCSLITRGAGGQITLLNSLNTNFGVAKAQGVDYELTYDTGAAHLNLPFGGAFNFDLQVSNALKSTTSNPDNTVNTYVGTFQYAAEAFTPRWKGNAKVEYRTGPWVAHWDGEWTQAVHSFDGGANVYSNTVPARFLHSISASYTFHSMGMLQKTRVTLGVDNLFDKDPPFLRGDSTCKCNSLAGPFDFVGRFVYGRVSAKF